ncbi:YaiI/YqxD family protein [Legionella sp. D16C41]|uniref:YaiI/YqxD family protein n=1 Tax=Legionella sp. D16C41 TaxID=3402688 RepID=UPI003AF8723A
MTSIWIDGDACPKAIKEIIFKAAIRNKIKCILVANQFMNLPPSPMIQRIIVDQGFDKADQLIIESILTGDIVITSDIPLAESCINKQAKVISPRGELFNANTIKQKLAIRDFNEVMRSSGLHSKGPNSLTQKDIKLFANQLDRLLVKAKK